MLSKISALNFMKQLPLIYTKSTNLLHTSEAQLKKKDKKKSAKQTCSRKIAVVLTGCGLLDGSEVTESVSTGIHLSRHKYITEFFAPNVPICGVVNHYSFEPDECSPRNSCIEAGRITRGYIKPLCYCRACEYCALIVPGGWGAARTLSDFASQGCNCVVLPELITLIKEFRCQCKPIGAVSFSAVLMAKVMEKAKVTLGKNAPKEQWPQGDAIETLKQMGAEVENVDVKGVTHCKKHNVFCTPGFLDAQASYQDVYDGVGKMIDMMHESIMS